MFELVGKFNLAVYTPCMCVIFMTSLFVIVKAVLCEIDHITISQNVLL